MAQDYYTTPPPNFFDDPGGYKNNLAKWGAAESAASGAAAKKKSDQQKRDRFDTNLGKYDELLSGQREKLLQGFRQGTEANVGRSLGAVNRSAALQAARAGGGGAGIQGGRGMALAEAGLRGQGQAAMSDFSTKLGVLQSQQRDAFVRGEFGFMNEMTKLEANQNFEQSMMMMTNRLQRDQESRNAFWGLAGSIGGWIGGGPIGGAIGGYLGNQAGGGGPYE